MPTAHSGLVAGWRDIARRELATVQNPLRGEPDVDRPEKLMGWVKALLHSVYDQPDALAVHAQFDRIVDALSDKLPTVAGHLDDARADILAFTAGGSSSTPRAGARGPRGGAVADATPWVTTRRDDHQPCPTPPSLSRGRGAGAEPRAYAWLKEAGAPSRPATVEMAIAGVGDPVGNH